MSILTMLLGESPKTLAKWVMKKHDHNGDGVIDLKTRAHADEKKDETWRPSQYD